MHVVYDCVIHSERGVRTTHDEFYIFMFTNYFTSISCKNIINS